MPIVFDKEFKPSYDEAVTLHPQIRLVTVENPSPFTFHGTNSYIIGRDTLAIIDPGPDDEKQFQRLLKLVDGHPVSHIFITHSHADHSPLSRRLSAHFSAPIVAEGKNRPSRPAHDDELIPLEAGADIDFTPDIALPDQAIIDGDGWAIRGIATPGHMANHMVFALEESDILFSGDHVMSWATTVIAPPDGNMQDYMRSLERLLTRNDRAYLPGHGAPLKKPLSFVRGIKAHRKMRERAILERLAKGDHSIAAMVQVIYRDIDPRLHKAAGLSVFAHLEDLVARGIVLTDGTARLFGHYSLS